MSKLDEWKLEASATYVNGLFHPYSNAEDINQLNKRILILIDLIRKKGDILKSALAHLNDDDHFEAFVEGSMRVKEALKLTENLK